MITFFYTFLLAFIWNEFYYIFNRKRLNTNFENKDIDSMRKMDLVYYSTRVLYWIWMIVGIFSGLPTLFLVLFILGFIKFPLYHISGKIYKVYENVLPFFSIVLLIGILVFKFIS